MAKAYSGKHSRRWPSLQIMHFDETHTGLLIIPIENATSLPREIPIDNGILKLDPKRKPCDSMIQTFFLNSMFWYYVGDLDQQEQTKMLERDIEFARYKLGFRFIHQETKKEVSNGAVINAVLKWKQHNVKEHVPGTTFRHLQEATINMMTTPKIKHQIVQGVQGRPHRLQRVVDELTVTAVSSDEGDAEDLSSSEPQPLDVGSNHSIIPDIPFDQLSGLFDSVDSQPEQEEQEANISPQEIITNPEHIVSQEQIESTAVPGARRTTRVTSDPHRVSTNDVSLSDQSNGLPKVWSGDKRSLEQLRRELDQKHPVCNKKRRIERYDVVSGKGEKAKQQNEHFLAMIRGCAPVYQSMRTENPDKDLDDKRRLACLIALEIADNGGCFVGKDECPLSPKAAFKRVMTSLKDWRRPRGTPTPRSPRLRQDEEAVANQPSGHVEAFAIDEATAIELAASGGPLDIALPRTVRPVKVSSIDAELEALISEPMFDLDPSDPILKTAV